MARKVPSIKNTEFIITSKFNLPVKNSKCHKLRIRFNKSKFSDFSIGVCYEFTNDPNYVYIFKHPSYPKVMIITRRFYVRATVWDTIQEASEALERYTIYSHRVDAGDLGITYIISPDETLDYYPYPIPIAEYIEASEEVPASSRVSGRRIEQTSSARVFRDLKQKTFEAVRIIASKRISDIPESKKTSLFNSINHGRQILTTEGMLDMYLYSYGKMHEAKLKYAFSKMPGTFLRREGSAVNIVDYGCGQGVASMCFKDYLRTKRKNVTINKITLIDPSEIALHRAKELCKLFYPDTNVVAINKDFDSLTRSDLKAGSGCTVHLFSNVTDLDFDIDLLANKINTNLKGENWFVIVSPLFSNDYDFQMDDLVDALDASLHVCEDMGADEFELYNCTCRIAILRKIVKKI